MAHTPRARPVEALTQDGRVMREVLTYARRGSRLSPKQQRAWDAHAQEWVIPDESMDLGFEPDAAFGRRAPLVVEIGAGVGETTAAVAAAYPDHNVLAFEVWIPGIADGLARLEEVGAVNARYSGRDALWVLANRIPPDAVTEMLTFFPDPWQKKRHHKRRMVTPGNAALIASRIKPGGVWRLATDWPEYAEQMIEVLDAEPSLRGGVVDRWDGRPLTKFERRGIAEGRPITDVAYTRV